MEMRGAWKPIGVTIASITLFCLLPSVAAAGDHWAFRAPAARPTDHPDPNRHSYGVPQAPESPACTPHFCVHWVAEGRDAPNLADLNGIADGDGIPDFVEQVEGVAEHVYEVENVNLGWRDPRPDGRAGGAFGKTDVHLAQVGGSL